MVLRCPAVTPLVHISGLQLPKILALLLLVVMGAESTISKKTNLESRMTFNDEMKQGTSNLIHENGFSLNQIQGNRHILSLFSRLRNLPLFSPRESASIDVEGCDECDQLHEIVSTFMRQCPDGPTSYCCDSLFSSGAAEILGCDCAQTVSCQISPFDLYDTFCSCGLCMPRCQSTGGF